jgi:hypothetical protein
MIAFQHYAAATALAGLMSLMACGTIPVGQPGAVLSPSLMASTSAPAASTTGAAAPQPWRPAARRGCPAIPYCGSARTARRSGRSSGG